MKKIESWIGSNSDIVTLKQKLNETESVILKTLLIYIIPFKNEVEINFIY